MSFTFYVFLYCLLLFLLFRWRHKGKYLYLVFTLPVLIFAHSFVDTNTIPDLPVYKMGFEDVLSINIFKRSDIVFFGYNHDSTLKSGLNLN